MIQVEVSTTFLSSAGKDFIILLESLEDERTLPISIGQVEAQSIAIHLNKVPFPRPLTHDLFKSLIDESGLKFLRTVVRDLKDDTFYAWLVFEKGNKTVEIDARPSDAIAIALRFCAPIYVEEAVMNTAGVIIPQDTAADIELAQPDTNLTQPQKNEVKAPLTPLESLQKKLEEAVVEERYEEAASLRDEIENFTQFN